MAPTDDRWAVSVTGGIVLREMVPADLDAVAALEAEVASDGWNRELFAGEFTVAPESRHWVVAADADGTLAGFAGVMLSLDEAHIMNIAVDPRFRRQGVARRLLEALLTQASDRGAVAATLEVRVTNTAAIALYETFGFVAEGCRPGYFSDGEAATIMWAKNLPRLLRGRTQQN